MRMKLKAFLTLLGPSLREKVIFKNYKYSSILWFLKNYLHPAEAVLKQNEFHSTYVTWQMICEPQVNATIGQIYILVIY
jgi:selenocysteine lyase/cysteine desulfurase